MVTIYPIIARASKRGELTSIRMKEVSPVLRVCAPLSFVLMHQACSGAGQCTGAAVRGSRYISWLIVRGELPFTVSLPVPFNGKTDVSRRLFDVRIRLSAGVIAV